MPWNPTLEPSGILAVHAALVPTGLEGEVVLFGGDEHNKAAQEPGGNFRKTRLYDAQTHKVLAPDPPIPSPDSDVFCAHHVFGADGRLLIAGGTQKWPESDGHAHDLDFLGHRRCWIYNHSQRRWREVRKLNRNPAQPDEEHSGGRWYPGLVTLGNGDIAAFFGHPDQQDTRHRNVLPERYNLASNTWLNLPKVMGSAGAPNSGGRRFLFFPRVYLLPNGKLFFATPMPTGFTSSGDGTHRSTAYDLATGDYVNPQVTEPEGAYFGWDRPAVLLPLLPAEEYRVRILFLGGVNPRRLDLGASSPSWQATAARPGAVASRDRRYSNAVLLPTGEVCLVGGVANVGNERPANGPLQAEDPVLQTEIYAPGIDWTAGTFSGADAWSLKESAQLARNYHSTALLLPNGKVWVAGGNFNAESGDPDQEVTVAGVTKPRGTKQIELYEPDYVAVPNRIRITSSPRFATYGESFDVTVDRPAAQVGHVALIRAGSVTHSTDNDQRFVGLTIGSRSGQSLTTSIPGNPNLVPPGHYMLWVMDTANRPCRLAKFIRVGHVGCRVVTDRSTFSEEEVQAAGGGGAATFTNAVYVHYDGFIATELTGIPSVQVTWADTGDAVPASQITLVSAGRLLEVTPGPGDTPQQITYPFHVRFPTPNIFSSVTDRRQLRVTFTLGATTCTETLDLTCAPNPYMIDIDPVERNAAWLSTDVRVFSLQQTQSKLGRQQGSDPIQFIRSCLDRLNDPTVDGDALFETLSTSAKLDLAMLGPPFLFRPIFNYAIARVRYRATTTTAQRVKCFFRMFNVAATGLEFSPGTTYRRTAVGPGTVPLLGTAGGEVASIPFFASPRVETRQGRSGAASMTTQSLSAQYEVLDIVPSGAGAEVTVFFGCWLDINRLDPRFPLAPGGSDGPWPESQCLPVLGHVRGQHMCLVAEIFFQDDMTTAGETPGSSDNLSQRNLAFLNAPNPGMADARTVIHTLEIKPSQLPFPSQLGAVMLGSPVEGGGLAAVGRKIRVDELMFRWHNLPAGTEVTLSFSDIDTEDVQRLAALRRSPLACEIVDRHTLRFRVAGATWVPIPGGRTLNIPALLSFKLPDSVQHGDEYKVTVHQVAGTGVIVGTCEFRIPVSKAELIVDEEARTLSVFKYILATVPQDNRWYPLLVRYVNHLGLRVDALGGDAGAVHANPDGSGRPYDPTGGPDDGGDPCRRRCRHGRSACWCLLAGLAGAAAVKLLWAAWRSAHRVGRRG